MLSKAAEILSPLEEGKGSLMRYMSQFFEKKQMRYVYNALRELGIVE